MDVDEVKRRLSDIALVGTVDPEEGHAKEDELHRDVLGAIADGEVDNPAELASLALESCAIDFPRWYA